MTPADMLKALAAGLDVVDANTADPTVSAGAKGLASVARLVAGILGDRTTEEALAQLERIRDSGVTPITDEDLARQVDETLR